MKKIRQKYTMNRAKIIKTCKECGAILVFLEKCDNCGKDIPISYYKKYDPGKEVANLELWTNSIRKTYTLCSKECLKVLLIKLSRTIKRI